MPVGTRGTAPFAGPPSRLAGGTARCRRRALVLAATALAVLGIAPAPPAAAGSEPPAAAAPRARAPRAVAQLAPASLVAAAFEPPETAAGQARAQVRKQPSPAPTRFAAFLDAFDARPYGRLWQDARSFYAERGDRPAWLGRDGRPTRAARALVAALADAASHGLDPELYGTAGLAAAVASPPDGDGALLLEARLTGAFLLHADDLAHGRAPAAARWTGGIPARRVDLAAALARAAGDRPAEELARVAPRAAGYRRLVEALAEHRELAADGGWGEVPEGEVMKVGEPVERERHRALVARLAITGDLTGAEARQLGVDPPVYRGRRGILSWLRRDRPAALPATQAATGAATGTETGTETPAAAEGEVEPPPLLYDERLAEGVRRFQRRHALEVDGVVGRQTLAALNTPVEERIAALTLNLERWRWLADELGPRHVVVDLGGQELVAVEDGRAALRMNLIVGTPRTPSPTLASEIAYLVVNPSWYVPASIVRNEIDPKLARDPGYLRRNGYERLPNGLLRQRPGPGNALGHLKFIFPNPYSVYLHDTPSRHLFVRAVRTFSHGCMRIADPRGFAAWLLAGQPELADVDRLLAQGVEHRIDLDRRVPVFVLYWTAAVGEDGEVRFHQDVYGRDAKLRAAMSRGGQGGALVVDAERP